MARIELTADPDQLVPFHFRLGDLVRTRSTGRKGRIVRGRYLGPVPTAGMALDYAIEYVVHPEQGPDFGALEVDLERRRVGSSPLTRRRVVGLVALSLLAAPLAVRAQPAGKVSRIGFLGSTSASDLRIGPMIEAFRQGLRDLGYVEGRTIVIESRWDEGKIDRLPVLAAELVGLKVDVLVAGGAPATRAAQQATRAIPIVMTAVSDPVALGFVASLARPGGNSTGSGYMGPETATKKLELLKETVPRIARVAVLFDPDGPTGRVTLTAMEPVAQALGLTLQPVGVRSPDDFTGAFSAMAAGRADALMLLPDAVILKNLRRLADLAIKQRLPSVGFREWPDAGGLIAYGVDLVPMYRRAATFVDKILKGAKPGDLPVEQATQFQLILNIQTAKALGITFPQSVLLRADRVIE